MRVTGPHLIRTLQPGEVRFIATSTEEVKRVQNYITSLAYKMRVRYNIKFHVRTQIAHHKGQVGVRYWRIDDARPTQSDPDPTWYSDEWPCGRLKLR